MDNNLAVVDAHICMEKCDDAKCLAKCPTHAIRPAVPSIVPGTESQESVAAACSVCASKQTGVGA